MDPRAELLAFSKCVVTSGTEIADSTTSPKSTACPKIVSGFLAAGFAWRRHVVLLCPACVHKRHLYVAPGFVSLGLPIRLLSRLPAFLVRSGGYHYIPRMLEDDPITQFPIASCSQIDSGS